MFLTTFNVMKKENNERIPKILYFKVIEDNELDNVYDFMVKVKNTMPDSKNFSLEPRDQIFVPYEMGAKIFALVDENNNIVGVRYISLLSHGKTEYALDIGLREEDADRIIYLKSTVIDLDYTGNGLQYKTLQFLKEYFKDLGYKKIMSTISPYNIFSLKNGFQTGLHIRALKKKYQCEEHPDGLWRYILYLDEDSLEDFDESYIYVNRTDLLEQIKLLDDGYIGVKLSDNKEQIIYAKKK